MNDPKTSIVASPDVVQSQAAAGGGGLWRPAEAAAAPPAQGEDTSSARLSYSAAAGTRDALRAFVDANPGDAAARAQLATEEQRVRDLGIRAGVIAPPKKFVAPTYEPAPKDGWFREEFSESEDLAALRASYQRAGNTAALAALDAQSKVSREERHKMRQIGKAVEEERARIRNHRAAGVNGHIRADMEDSHLREYAKGVKLEPLRPQTWLERAPMGSVSVEVVTAEDRASMSREMLTAYRNALNGEHAVDHRGREIKGNLGPFRPAAPPAPPEPLPARPQAAPTVFEVNGRKFARTNPVNPNGIE